MALALSMPGFALAQGQQGSGSPYSAHALGDLTGTGQVTLAGLGGLAVTVADPFSVARANPATYSLLHHTSYEMGATIRWTRMTIGDESGRGRSTRLLGFSLGVPFAKGRWGMALGLQPFSTVAYKFEDRQQVDGGTLHNEYTGSGGVNRAYIGFGRALWQRRDSTGLRSKLSAGANFEFLFGTVDATRKAYYPLGSGYYHSSVVSSLVLRAPTGTLGLMQSGQLVTMAGAEKRLKERLAHLAAKDKRDEMDWLNAGRDLAERKPKKAPKLRREALRWRAGVGVDLPAWFTAQHSSLATSFRLSGTVENPIDTAQRIDGAFGTLSLPFGLAAGFGIENSRWALAAELHHRDWSALRSDVEGYALRTDLVAATTYAIGASFRPAGQQGGSFLKRTTYRAGARYTQDPIALRDQAISQFGMSFGCSLPIAGASTRSRINLAVEHGQRGTTAEGLLSERYTNLHIGITITPDLREQWFKKRRID
ncbi:MAG: hypothetical protein IPF41_11870 [Flavobacteriales bacterium]|nr:hypothetical protein [Flavobacteriales bacterium]